jgi:hypothetical protein
LDIDPVVASFCDKRRLPVAVDERPPRAAVGEHERELARMQLRVDRYRDKACPQQANIASTYAGTLRETSGHAVAAAQSAREAPRRELRHPPRELPIVADRRTAQSERGERRARHVRLCSSSAATFSTGEGGTFRMG